jgi:hypothetical protein
MITTAKTGIDKRPNFRGEFSEDEILKFQLLKLKKNPGNPAWYRTVANRVKNVPHDLMLCQGGPFDGHSIDICTENNRDTLPFFHNGEIGKYQGGAWTVIQTAGQAHQDAPGAHQAPAPARRTRAPARTHQARTEPAGEGQTIGDQGARAPGTQTPTQTQTDSSRKTTDWKPDGLDARKRADRARKRQDDQDAARRAAVLTPDQADKLARDHANAAEVMRAFHEARDQDAAGLDADQDDQDAPGADPAPLAGYEREKARRAALRARKPATPTQAPTQPDQAPARTAPHQAPAVRLDPVAELHQDARRTPAHAALAAQAGDPSLHLWRVKHDPAYAAAWRAAGDAAGREVKAERIAAGRRLEAVRQVAPEFVRQADPAPAESPTPAQAPPPTRTRRAKAAPESAPAVVWRAPQLGVPARFRHV